LLTGIISSTKSFQGLNATPQSFAAAAKLIAYGADQQKVINNLYKNKSLSSLMLWGRVLARVKHLPKNKIAWSLFSKLVFANSGAQIHDLDGITDEIMNSVSQADIAFVLYETPGKDKNKDPNINSSKIMDDIKVVIKSSKSKYLEELSKKFNILPRDGIMKIKIPNSNLVNVEKDILEKIKSISP
jgi:nanoRNase/pAp phosphatase (c-di-AMP/oligoRNAs hydrolase)